jgi:hypothetical protein
MTAFPYDLQDDSLPRLGLIVLQVDETIEQDFRHLFAPDSVKLHISRIPSGAELTPDSIAQMETALPTAAGLLPPRAGCCRLCLHIRDDPDRRRACAGSCDGGRADPCRDGPADCGAGKVPCFGAD